MIRIVHGADLHLDSAFVGLSEEKARQRRQEGRLLLDRLAALVREEQADLMLLAGDLFDSRHVYPETLDHLARALANMDCPVFIAPGNHDPYQQGSPYASSIWPENVHIFRAEELQAVELPALNCVVYGAAFTSPQRESEVLADFTAPADGKIHLMCLHGDVGGIDGHYGPVTLKQLGDSGMDYVALGHIHQYSGLQSQGVTAWAYPGCPEGRGFDETGDKGVLVCDVERGNTQLRFVPLCLRRYQIVEADVSGKTAGQILDALLPDGENDLCRVIFTGETDEKGIDIPALEREYAGRFYVLQLRDNTRISRDIWERAGEDSLRGLFLRELRRQYESAATQEERDRIILAVRFGLAALDGRDI